MGFYPLLSATLLHLKTGRRETSWPVTATISEIGNVDAEKLKDNVLVQGYTHRYK